MTPIAELVAQARAAAAALLAGLDRAPGLTPGGWAAAAAGVEAVGRLVDAARVAVAAPVAESGSSLPVVVEALGARSGVDALAGCAGISEPEARRRLLLAEATAPGIGLSGAVLAPRLPALAAALGGGALGLESAAVIVRELGAVRARASAESLADAEAGLVAFAASREDAAPARTEFVADAAKAWAAAIDPDGARPREERMMRRRSLRLGIEDADGLIPISGRLALEVGLQLRALVEAHRRGEPGPVFVSAGESAESDGLARDERTPEQQRHDAFAAIVAGAARAVGAPAVGGAPPAVLVTVSASDLDDPDGRAGDAIGRFDGSGAPVSRASVERLIDRGGFQQVRVTATGAIVGISSAQRRFTPTQRRALVARDGGCVIPGCRIPAGWCEVHHVVPWRDGGRTETANGALLCWWHHSKIDTGPWRIRMIDGIPHLRGPGRSEWTPHRAVRMPLRR